MNELDIRYIETIKPQMSFIGTKVHLGCWGGRDREYWRESRIATRRPDGTSHLLDAVKNNRTKNSTYISVSGFYGDAQSRIEIYNIAVLDRIVIDIDPYNHSIGFGQQTIELLQEMILGYHIAPSFIISSGHGLQVVYLFDQMHYVNEKLKLKYDAVVKAIAEELENIISEYVPVKIDKLTVNSYYRLPGTYNRTASMRSAVIWASDDLKTHENRQFSDLCELLAIQPPSYGYNKPKTPTFPGEMKRQIAYTKKDLEPTRYDSFVFRMKHDYVSLISHNKHWLWGFRNIYLYCFARNIQAAYSNQDIIFNAVLDLNAYLEYPLKRDEVKNICTHAKDDYDRIPVIYSFAAQLQWILKHLPSDYSRNIQQEYFWLPITKEEQQHRKSESMKAAHRKSKQKLKAQRHQKKAEKIAAVQEMHAEGLSIMEISRRTGCSRNTIKKYLREAQ